MVKLCALPGTVVPWGRFSIATTQKAFQHAQHTSMRSWDVHEVWCWNLDEEFAALIAAVSGEADVVLAVDTEFPGLPWRYERQDPSSEKHSEARYRILCKNVNSLRPIQVGIAVSRAGSFNCVWNFHLRFNIAVDLYEKAAVSLLHAAGVDFDRHASEGIQSHVLGDMLAGSPLFGWHQCSPLWVTFSGEYDLAFLVKLLRVDQPLPRDPAMFESVLSFYLPRRHELRAQLPRGSLEVLAQMYAVVRHGQPHTAGSDALLTLELYQCLANLNAKSDRKPHQANAWKGWHDNGWCQQWDGSWGYSDWTYAHEQRAEIAEAACTGGGHRYGDWSYACEDASSRCAYSLAPPHVSTSQTVSTASTTAPGARDEDAQGSTSADSSQQTFSAAAEDDTLAETDSNGAVADADAGGDADQADADADNAANSICDGASTSDTDADVVDSIKESSISLDSAVKCYSLPSKWFPKWVTEWISGAVANTSQSWGVSVRVLGNSSRASLLVSLESFYVMAVFAFSLLLLILFPPCASSLVLLPLHMILLMIVWSWTLPSQPPMLLSAYLVGCCIRLGAAVAAAGTRLWINY